MDGTDHTIAITSGVNNSLDGIMQAINDADIGVSASIVNDGDPTNPYRLTMSGDTVGQEFTISDDTVALEPSPNHKPPPRPISRWMVWIFIILQIP